MFKLIQKDSFKIVCLKTNNEEKYTQDNIIFMLMAKLYS